MAAHVSHLIASQVSVGFFGGWFGLCHIFAISIPRSRPRSPRDWRDDAPLCVHAIQYDTIRYDGDGGDL